MTTLYFTIACEGGDKNIPGSGGKECRLVCGKYGFGYASHLYHELRRRRELVQHDEDLTSSKCPEERLVGYVRYEKGVRFPESMKPKLYMWEPPGSRKTRSGVDADPKPKRVRGTLACKGCGTHPRDYISATSIAMFVGEREDTGRLRPSFCTRCNPIRGRMDPAVVDQRVFGYDLI